MVIISTSAVDVSIQAVSPALRVGAGGAAGASVAAAPASWARAGSSFANSSTASAATTAAEKYLASLDIFFLSPLER